MFHMDHVLGLGLQFSVNGFNLVHGILATILWIIALIASIEYMAGEQKLCRYYIFTVLTYFATLGVFFSADLYTTFIFFEVMSFTSYIWVAQTETSEAKKASNTYLTVAVVGGLVMLFGLFYLYNQTGTLVLSELTHACASLEDKIPLYIAGGCFIFGFGAKAGIFPLHIWMADSYASAPAPASALLSGILSKTGIWGMLVVTANIFLHDIAWGTFILVLGVLTMLLGAIFAFFSIDLKRTLAFSSMSQVGFIIIGIGMSGLLAEHNTIAARGTILHMINHSVIKLILFLIAGLIFKNLGSLNLNDIRGYGRQKSLLKLVFATSALGIGGVPFFNGYISKTLLHESIVEGIHLSILSPSFLGVVEWLFLISGGFTVAYMCKLWVAIFVEKNLDSDKQAQFDSDANTYVSLRMKVILLFCALSIGICGTLPYLTLDKLADFTQNILYAHPLAHEIDYFSLMNLQGVLISLGIGALLYLVGIRRLIMRPTDGGTQYISRWPEWLSLNDLVYRPLFLYLLPNVFRFLMRLLDSVVDWLILGARATFMRDSKLPQEVEEGNVFTYRLGRILNGIETLINRLFFKGRTSKRNYVHLLAVRLVELEEDRMIIARSMSFGLVLFCIGLSITLIYMLF